MSELPPEIRALLAHASAEHDPTEREVERNLDALHGSLAFSAPALLHAADMLQAGTSAAPAAPAASAATYTAGSLVGASGVKLYVVVAAVIGSVGTAAVFGGTREKAQPPAARAPVTAPVLAQREPLPAVEPVHAEPAPVVAVPKPVRKAARVSDELALIEGVQRALDMGNANGALAQLDQHARTFPRGVLRNEREGLRAIALCAAGRRREGWAARDAFLARAGSTPIASRVREACRDD